MLFVNFNNNMDIGEYSNNKIPLCTITNKQPIRIQIPRMYMPFGISGFTPEVGPTKWNIDFSMKGWEEEGNYIQTFFKFIKEIENTIINHVHENSSTIFGTQKSIEELKQMFNSNIKETHNDREPKFRVKVDTKTAIFDSTNTNKFDGELSPNLYAQHSGVAIVELNSVYFFNKMFGCTWKLHQLQIFEPQRLKGFRMILD